MSTPPAPGPALLLRGDATRLPVADETVDLVVTSPPFFGVREYEDDGRPIPGQIGAEPSPKHFLDSLMLATEEMARTLKRKGSIFVNLDDKYARNGGGGKGSSDGFVGRAERPPSTAHGFPEKSLMGLPWRYAIRCIDELGLRLRAEIIWEKPNSMPESVTDRVQRSHERWFHFTKEMKHYTAIDELRKPLDDGLLGALPTSVWSISTERMNVPKHIGVKHRAPFPQELPRRFILGWCPPGICIECGDGRRYLTVREGEGRRVLGMACGCAEPTAPTVPALVLDPFCGSGTTPMVARALGRRSIGVDLSADYLRLAAWRVFDSGHARKSIERTYGLPT
jgi:DNA modification methylase